MRLVRFMGLDEFEKLMGGKTLYNTTDWKNKTKVTVLVFVSFLLLMNMICTGLVIRCGA